MGAISRAQFLRGDWRGERPVIRPPWALPEAEFSRLCDGCGDCVDACPRDLVFMARGKLPLIDFSADHCNFCGDCRRACDTGALGQALDRERPPWRLQADINTACLAISGTYCVRCLEACEHDAIDSKPVLGGRFTLSVDPSACTGCGACIAPCPVDAIAMAHPRGKETPGRVPVRRTP